MVVAKFSSIKPWCYILIISISSVFIFIHFTNQITLKPSLAENLKLIQSNLYKMTTLGTRQKWSSWTGGRLIKHLHKWPQTKSGRSWQFVSFYSHCEWSIDNKGLLEQRFAISCVLVPFIKIKNVSIYFWFWIYLYLEVVLHKWCLSMSVNLVKLANVFQCNVFISENKRRTGYDINIAK